MSDDKDFLLLSLVLLVLSSPLLLLPFSILSLQLSLSMTHEIITRFAFWRSTDGERSNLCSRRRERSSDTNEIRLPQNRQSLRAYKE